MIKEAEVSLDPLCVIAGVNDNGKSTIGKVVFCVIKALNHYKTDLNVSKEKEVEEFLARVYFGLREAIKQDHMAEVWPKVRESLTTELPIENIRQVFDELALVLYERESLDSDGVILLQRYRHELNALLDQPEDQRSILENAFTRVFAAEFDSQVLLSGAQEGLIQVWENNLQLIHLSINSNNEVKLNVDIEPMIIRDATFIETPLILNFHDLLIRSQTQLEERDPRKLGRPYTTLHIKDLFEKLRVPVLPPVLVEASPNVSILKYIKAVVDGELSYDKSLRNFVFKRDSENISIKNTASGIKVFGLLQILLANEFITKNTLVVFDEPENHLHPKWQLKLAEVLVELVSQGVYIIVSSHSPYMIEALERYSALKGLEGSCSFYLAENNKVENKSQLPEIFALLSEPFDEFRRLDAKALHDE